MDYVMQQVKEHAMKYPFQKVVLFGSRARGDHSLVSDYDIAVTAEKLTAVEKASFTADLEEIDTLKEFDIVFIDSNSTHDLRKNISEEGITIYEQIRK